MIIYYIVYSVPFRFCNKCSARSLMFIVEPRVDEDLSRVSDVLQKLIDSFSDNTP